MLFRLVLISIISTPLVLCGVVRQIGSSCPLVCPQFYHALCGSDGKTYDNECYLKAAMCRDPVLRLAHDGPCTGHVRRLVCTTPVCWPTYEPVCGSDGITYGNGCHLSNARCYDQDLKVAHNGPCITSPKPTFSI